MKYVALLRGINVGGKNIVKMAVLRAMFSDLSFRHVRTYIQSGNVVFETEAAPAAAQGAIQQAFRDTFGFESAIMLRTDSDIAAVMKNLPFSRQEIDAAERSHPAVEHLYVYFAEEAPEEGQIARLSADDAGLDRLQVVGREMYLLCHGSIRDSKLAAALTKLKPSLTARSWKTVGKVYDLLHP